MYLFRFLNTPLGGGGQHRRLPRTANTLAPPLLVMKDDDDDDYDNILRAGYIDANNPVMCRRHPFDLQVGGEKCEVKRQYLKLCLCLSLK